MHRLLYSSIPFPVNRPPSFPFNQRVKQNILLLKYVSNIEPSNLKKNQ